MSTEQTIELPEGLPPLPKLPEGYTKWEYHAPETPVMGLAYATRRCGAGEYHEWIDCGPIELPSGVSGIHYITPIKEQFKKQEGWIAVKDQYPDLRDIPIKACYAGVSSYWHMNKLDQSGRSPIFTHWMRDDTPPIPEKVKTQEEIDHESCASTWKSRACGDEFNGVAPIMFKYGWHAALDWERTRNSGGEK